MNFGNAVTIIGITGVYIIAILEYIGIYWPLKIKYEEHKKRRLFQKINASIEVCMASAALLGIIVFSDSMNQLLYYGSSGLFIALIILNILNRNNFAKQKGIYK